MSYEESDWNVGSTNDELPIIIRARSTLPDQIYKTKYQHLIIVKWKYTCSDRGMPDESSQEAMNSFEQKLEASLINKKIGVLAATKTGQSQKEWRYYNLDTQEFMATLNEISDPNSPFPIDLQLFNDPTWEALSEVISK
jgi:hypothetical protein